MKTSREFLARFKTPIFFTIVTITSVIGAFIALSTVDRYQIIVNAVLGLTVLYEFYKDFRSIKKKPDEPKGIHIELPRDLKYLGIALFLTVIGIWAGSQILYLIWFLLNLSK